MNPTKCTQAAKYKQQKKAKSNIDGDVEEYNE